MRNNWHLTKNPTILSVLRGIERDIRTQKRTGIALPLYADSMAHHAIRKSLGMKDIEKSIFVGIKEKRK